MINYTNKVRQCYPNAYLHVYKNVNLSFGTYNAEIFHFHEKIINPSYITVYVIHFSHKTSLSYYLSASIIDKKTAWKNAWIRVTELIKEKLINEK
jgi:hypothetical protein